MSWQDELITSTSEAEEFLRRHLSALGISPIHFNFHKKDCIYFSAETEVDGKLEGILSFEMYASDYYNDCTWHNFYIEPNFRGNKLSPLAIKSVIGIAYEFSQNAIWLYSVRQDGLTYWPTVTGAVPKIAPIDLERHIDTIIEERKDEIDFSSIRLLRRIQELAAVNPFGGWRALSQTNIRLANGQYFKGEAFRRVCNQDYMVIPLGDIGARQILQGHIGQLPPFRPSENDHDFGTMISQLESYRKTQAPLLGL